MIGGGNAERRGHDIAAGQRVEDGECGGVGDGRVRVRVGITLSARGHVASGAVLHGGELRDERDDFGARCQSMFQC